MTRRKADPVAKAAYDLARRLADPERKRAASRAYYLANREKIIARSRQWAIDHPESVEARNSRNNPEPWRAYKRRYQQGHLETGRVSTANYRLRRQGNLTKAEWLVILDESDHRCAYCNSSELIEMEHAIPLSRGGAHSKENVVPACRSCNRRKGGMTAIEFLAKLSPNTKE